MSRPDCAPDAGSCFATVQPQSGSVRPPHSGSQAQSLSQLVVVSQAQYIGSALCTVRVGSGAEPLITVSGQHSPAV